MSEIADRRAERIVLRNEFRDSYRLKKNFFKHIINAELFIEKNLDAHIVTIQGLYSKFNIDGYSDFSSRRIFIDLDIFMSDDDERRKEVYANYYAQARTHEWVQVLDAWNLDIFIEEILDLSIVPLNDLYKETKIDGFPCFSHQRLFVDEDIFFSTSSKRYHTVLARCIAHWELHMEIFLKADFLTADEYIKFEYSFSDKEFLSILTNANNLAAEILVPLDHILVEINSSHGTTSQRLDQISDNLEVERHIVMRRIEELGLGEQVGIK